MVRLELKVELGELLVVGELEMIQLLIQVELVVVEMVVEDLERLVHYKQQQQEQQTLAVAVVEEVVVDHLLQEHKVDQV